MIKRGNRNILIDKKAQGVMGLQFSTIFSIILIIIFIGFAIYVITQFLIPSLNCSKVGIFVDALQEVIDSEKDAATYDHISPWNLPSSIKLVCFADLNDRAKGTNANIFRDLTLFKSSNKNPNMFFYPTNAGCDRIPYKTIEHIDIVKITSGNNPYCIPVKNGKISLRIIKENEDSQFIIQKA
jgi:hypothetical protein